MHVDTLKNNNKLNNGNIRKFFPWIRNFFNSIPPQARPKKIEKRSRLKNQYAAKIGDTPKLTSTDYKDNLTNLGYQFRLNLAGHKIEVNGTTLTDGIMSTISNEMYDDGYTNMGRLRDVIYELAESNKYHPVQEYFSKLKWDGNNHIERFASYFSDQEGIFHPVLRKFLIGAVGKVLEPDDSQRRFNHVLILDGKQGLGKSCFAQFLCSKVPWWFRSGSINPRDKDYQIATSENLIWEISEIAETLNNSTSESLKQFFTTSKFSARKSYGRYNEDFVSIVSFIGTSNNIFGLLNDPTGHRRFRIVTLLDINWKEYRENIDIDQVWAEAVEAYKKGETLDLPDDIEKIINKTNDNYYKLDLVCENIKNFFDIDPYGDSWICYRDIVQTLRDPKLGNLSENETSSYKVARALKKLNCESMKRKDQRGYRGIKLKTSANDKNFEALLK